MSSIVHIGSIGILNVMSSGPHLHAKCSLLLLLARKRVDGDPRASGGDFGGISAYGGHQDPSITARLYIHGKLGFDKLNGYHDKLKGKED